MLSSPNKGCWRLLGNPSASPPGARTALLPAGGCLWALGRPGRPQLLRQIPVGAGTHAWETPPRGRQVTPVLQATNHTNLQQQHLRAERCSCFPPKPERPALPLPRRAGAVGAPCPPCGARGKAGRSRGLAGPEQQGPRTPGRAPPLTAPPEPAATRRVAAAPPPQPGPAPRSPRNPRGRPPSPNAAGKKPTAGDGKAVPAEGEAPAPACKSRPPRQRGEDGGRCRGGSAAPRPLGERPAPRPAGAAGAAGRWAKAASAAGTSPAGPGGRPLALPQPCPPPTAPAFFSLKVSPVRWRGGSGAPPSRAENVALFLLVRAINYALHVSAAAFGLPQCPGSGAGSQGGSDTARPGAWTSPSSRISEERGPAKPHGQAGLSGPTFFQQKNTRLSKPNLCAGSLG